MRPPFVVLLHPRIQVGLEFLQRSIDLLSERHAVQLVQHRFVEPFTDPVGLRMPRLGARVIDVFHGEVQFATRGRPRRLFNGDLHDRLLHLRRPPILEEGLLPRDLLEGGLAAGLVEHR